MVEPKAFQDALLAYDARPADREAEAVRAAVLEQVAAMLDEKADDYANECGNVDPDTGALEFGRGWQGEVREDSYNTLRELADEVRAMNRTAGVSVAPHETFCDQVLMV